MLFKPTMYQKNIYEIDYTRLKKNGVHVLVFDLDNTLALIDEVECPKRSSQLIEKLKKDFVIYIISNNEWSRIKPYVEQLGIKGIAKARKPFTKGLKRIIKDGYHKCEMVMIGDQLVTDILSGNLFSIQTIWTDPLGEKDLKITRFNRFLEGKILKRYTKKKILERGKYYE